MTKTLLAASLSLLVACTDEDGGFDTPRSEVPAPLAGDWFTGSLSTIQYYDETTGQFADPSGEGFYFIFGSDGIYETGAAINSTVSGCTARLLGDERGTLVVDGPNITVYRDYVTVQVTNTCGNSGTRTQGAETRQLTWSVRRDESNLEWLDLRHTDGSVETYRRW